MVLVVDRSGSMGHRLPNGRTPMSYAKTSALETARALTEGDQVGIVTFGNKGAGRVELEMTDALQATQVRAGVEKLAHGMEFTYLLSGLKQADRLLRPVRAAVKHVVVISDGEFDTSESVALRALANKMAQQGHMSVTILAIVSGRGSSLFMRYAEEIATDGGGQFLAIQAAEQVPVDAEIGAACGLCAAGHLDVALARGAQRVALGVRRGAVVQHGLDPFVARASLRRGNEVRFAAVRRPRLGDPTLTPSLTPSPPMPTLPSSPCAP